MKKQHENKHWNASHSGAYFILLRLSETYELKNDSRHCLHCYMFRYSFGDRPVEFLKLLLK